jgi:hypothetical protein
VAPVAQLAEREDVDDVGMPDPVDRPRLIGERRTSAGSAEYWAFRILIATRFSITGWVAE